MLATNSAQQGLLPVWMFNQQEARLIRRPLLPHGPLLIQRLQPMQEQLPYMIMPQSSVGCKVKITAGITITKNGTTIYSGDLQQYTIATGNIPADEFEKSKHYLLKMID
ncbi:MAG: hypothetical protein ACLR8Y_03505 [Alistipes indistinctus]